ncbi:hypothetical protein OAA06_01585 [bacterium]|nr:hypothetical protein [bacterium]
MKTSRIIFISYFSVFTMILIGVMISGFAYNDMAKEEWRKHCEEVSKGHNNTKDRYSKNSKIEKLHSFSHVFVKEGCTIHILQGDSAKLIYSNKESKKKVIPPNTEVKNDTLFIYQTKPNEVTVVAKELSSVSGNNCEVTLNHMDLAYCNLVFDNSKVGFMEKLNLKKVDLQLTNKCDAWGYFVSDEVNMNISNSKFNGWKKMKIGSLNAVFRDSAKVFLHQAKRMKFDVDESSDLRLDR